MNTNYSKSPCVVADTRQEEPHPVETLIPAGFAVPDFPDFKTAVAALAFDAGFADPTSGISALPVFHFNHAAGFHYSAQHRMIGEVRFGLTTAGYLMMETSIVGEASRRSAHFY
ncbi:MAG: hypothetical protein EBX52_09400, partial [Proteobacteria bacterium]|nr:hypothetical protein [Pseudomonadota bacterium]